MRGNSSPSFRFTLSRVLGAAALAGVASCADGTGPGTPVREDPLLPPASRVVALAAAFQTTCALTADDLVHCWGENRSGEFGDGTVTPSAAAVPGAGGMRFRSLHGSVGTAQMCGITRADEAFCWGYNLNGELGDGTTSDRYSPVPVAGGLRFAAIASSYHTCGLTVQRRAYCWGSGLGGQLGTGGSASQRTPSPVATSLSFTHITNGMQFSCALVAGGDAHCWGWSVGLGNGGTGSVDVPVPVSGGLRFERISAAEEHVCALAAGGQPYCWGKFGPGWPGDYRPVPTAILGGHRFVDVAASSRLFVGGAACALTASGEAFCWYGGGEPVPVPGNYRFAGLVGRHGGFCGYTPGGAAACWKWEINHVNEWVLGLPTPIPALSS
ncbi:MAG: hypothetical protein AVDCRST_MAG89-10 [uncultured Gemmatimonadetes bacterium]|uniref:BNR repeat domain protein n=1 Tax=uncultured Gemmatimonadota bacterium TaxID=203437 RepID=A0A6J4K2Y3_9BACT|nr:MAG: hypothetical protein AVDCRST_MAG89-10 [uncultured Gemmatimonadota bacterium]